MHVDSHRHGRLIALRFPSDTWPAVVGLLEQAYRTHVAMCLQDTSWTWLVTKREICSKTELRHAWAVYAGPIARLPARATTIYDGPEVTLAAVTSQ